MKRRTRQSTPSGSGQTLTTETLRSLTGWTERHLRDLAKANWFPKPDHGKYQTGPTIKGIIDYLKDQLAKKDDTEKKSRAIYWSKKAERETFEFDQEQGRYVPLSELGPVLRNLILHMQAVLRRKMELELPARLRNKTEPEMRDEMKRSVDDLFKLLREGVSKWLL